MYLFIANIFYVHIFSIKLASWIRAPVSHRMGHCLPSMSGILWIMSQKFAPMVMFVVRKS
jgi:hypothetical protein